MAVALVALTLAAVPATAESGAAVAKAFGTREYVRRVCLLPDGAKIGILTSIAPRGVALMIADPASGKPPAVVMTSTGAPDRIYDCDWVTPERLVVKVYTSIEVNGQPLGFTRLFTIDADGKNTRMLSAKQGVNALEVAQNGAP